jgi:hypothetical protein
MHFIFSVMYVELCKSRSCTLLRQQCTDTMVDYFLNFEHIRQCPIVYHPINSGAQ